MISLFNNQPIPFRAADNPLASRRSFDAGAQTRLTSQFGESALTLDGELRQNLRRIRHRCRLVFRNDPYVKKFVALCQSNILGAQGIRLQSRAKFANGKLDLKLNAAVETAWKQWSKKATACVSTKNSWRDLQNWAVLAFFRDGEFLFQKVPAKNEFGFSLRKVDVDFLDETYNEKLANGNRVIMSVEVDQDERPVAYYLTEPRQDTGYRFQNKWVKRTRVPASEMIHVFQPTEALQTRGVPALVSVLFRLKMLGAYEEAEVVAARIGASKMGFYEKSAAVDSPYLGDGAKKDSLKAPIEEVEAGTFHELPTGWKFTPFDPDHPTQGFEAFVSAILRGISVGLLVSYESLTGDLSKVNFSSIRAGAITEQDLWRSFQAFFKEHLCDDVFEGWISNAYLTGKLTLKPGDFERAKAAIEWQSRGWSYVNPKQEVEADIVAINNGLRTITSVLSDSGLDIEEVIVERKAEIDLFKQYGVSLPTGDQSQTKFTDNQPSDSESPPPNDAADNSGN